MNSGTNLPTCRYTSLMVIGMGSLPRSNKQIFPPLKGHAVRKSESKLERFVVPQAAAIGLCFFSWSSQSSHQFQDAPLALFGGVGLFREPARLWRERCWRLAPPLWTGEKRGRAAAQPCSPQTPRTGVIILTVSGG